VIEKGEKVGTLYLCTGNVDYSISLASTRVDKSLWNHRIGHTSKKQMKIHHKRNLFLDLKQIDLIYVSTMFMENIRESYFSKSERKIRVKN
jgi:hypothetical protein